MANKGGKRVTWASHELELLKALYPDNTAREVALIIKRGESSIYSKANQLKLEKSAAFLNGSKSGRTTGKQGMATRFKKGETPWNKGKSYEAGGRSAETQFKTGSKPHNYKPIGSERWFGGYLQRKVTDTGKSVNDWVEVHRLMWIEENGPIPESHVVVFKNGNKADIRLSNLELISRGELARRNSIHRYPPELVGLMQLNGRVNKQIKKRAEHEKQD